MATLSPRPTTEGDHLAFDAVGLPAFDFIQDPGRDPRVRHSVLDTLDKVDADDLANNAAIVAWIAYRAANEPDRVPRKPLPPPDKRRGRPVVSGALIPKSTHAVRLLGAALLSAALAVGLVTWSETRDRWVLEAPPGIGPRAARLSLAAEGPIQGWLESATPRLDVRCLPSAGIEFEVTTGLAAAVEPGNQRTVRYWFDEDEDTLTTWTQSAESACPERPNRRRRGARGPPGDGRALPLRLHSLQR